MISVDEETHPGTKARDPNDACTPYFWWPPGLATSLRPRKYSIDFGRSLIIYLFVTLNVLFLTTRVLSRDCPITFTVDRGCVHEPKYQGACNLSCLEYSRVLGIVRVCSQFLLPFFFFLSGRAAIHCRSGPLVQFFRRLVHTAVPLFTAIIILVPLSSWLLRDTLSCVPSEIIPMSYVPSPVASPFTPLLSQARGAADLSRLARVSQDDVIRRPIEDFGKFWQQWYPQVFASCAGFEWAWPYVALFSVFVFNILFLNWLNVRYDNPSVTGWDATTDMYHLLGMVIQLAVFVLVYGPVVDLARAAGIAAPYCFYIVLILTRHLWRPFAPALPQVIAPVFMVAMAVVDGPELPRFVGVTTVAYLNLFFLGGAIGELTVPEARMHQSGALIIARPLWLAVRVALFVVALPVSDIVDADSLYDYPLFAVVRPFGTPTRIPPGLFVLGSWMWIDLLQRLVELYEVDPPSIMSYRFLTRFPSCLFLVHFPLIALYERVVIHLGGVFLHSGGLWLGVLIVFLLTVGSALVIYAICYYLPYLGAFLGVWNWSKLCMPSLGFSSMYGVLAPPAGGDDRRQSERPAFVAGSHMSASPPRVVPSGPFGYSSGRGNGLSSTRGGNRTSQSDSPVAVVTSPANVRPGGASLPMAPQRMLHSGVPPAVSAGGGFFGGALGRVLHSFGSRGDLRATPPPRAGGNGEDLRRIPMSDIVPLPAPESPHAPPEHMSPQAVRGMRSALDCLQANLDAQTGDRNALRGGRLAREPPGLEMTPIGPAPSPPDVTCSSCGMARLFPFDRVCVCVCVCVCVVRACVSVCAVCARARLARVACSWRVSD